jgi:hypothetical protein
MTRHPFRVHLVTSAIGAAACAESAMAPKTTSERLAQFNDDVSTIGTAATSPVATSLFGLGYAIDRTIAETIFGAPQSISHRGTARSAHAVQKTAVGSTAVPSNGASALASLAPLTGKTLRYDRTTSRYVMSAQSGAPADGIRFVLYNFTPASGVVTVPLVEGGYADITPSSGAWRVTAYSGLASPTVQFDYTVTASGPVTARTFVLAGFVSSSTSRTDFTHTVAFDAQFPIQRRGQLSVAVSGIAWDVTQTLVAGKPLAITGTLIGTAGRLRIEESSLDTLSTYAITINESAVATVTVRGNTRSTKDAGGNALPAQDDARVLKLLDAFNNPSPAFGNLHLPVYTLSFLGS